jgi:hypothetical protein
MGGTGDRGGVECFDDLLEEGVFEVLLSRLSDEYDLVDWPSSSSGGDQGPDIRVLGS